MVQPANKRLVTEASGDVRYVVKLPAPTGVAATDTPRILAAALACSNAGGGEVHYREGLYKLNAYIPIYTGVSHIGIPLLQTQSGQGPGGAYLADSAPTFSGGTVLQGDGTFAAFWDGLSDLGTAPGTLGAEQKAGVKIYGFGLDNFTYGIRCGAKNVMGLVWSEVDQVYVKNCSVWGIYLANFVHVKFGFIADWFCENGQYYGSQMNAGDYQGGNSVFDALFHLTPQDGRDRRLGRGIVFEAMQGSGSSGGALNEIEVHRVQVNAYNKALLSVTATLTNASSDVAVPDGTKFRAGMVVTFGSTVGGFTVGLAYVVKAVVGNNLTLATSRTGTAITANAGGTPTLNTYGFPSLEVTAADANSHVTSSFINHIDVEGNSSAGVYLENPQRCEFTVSSGSATALVDIVARAVTYSDVRSRPTASTDFDTASSSTRFNGARKASFNRYPAGHYFDSARSTWGMSVGFGQSSGVSPDLEVSPQGVLYPNVGVAERVTARNTNTSLSGSQVGHVPHSSASAHTHTLPTIVARATPLTATEGHWFQFHNTGAGALTVNTDGTQLFNRIAAKTSINIATGQCVRVTAVNDGVALYWSAEQITMVT